MNEEELEIARGFVDCSRWQWLPGIRAVGRKGYPAAWFRVEEPLRRLGGVWRDSVPDITDPATLGCILHLVRDVWGSPTAYLYCYGRSWFFEPQQPDPTNHPSGRTEAETLLHALQVAPEVISG